MTLLIHRANRMEDLAGTLAGIVEAPRSDPVGPEVIVVQSRGMERWLAMELARRLGVWANAEFPFPRKFLEREIARVLGVEEATWRAFMPENLAWTVAAMLPAYVDRPGFEDLRRYLAGDRRLLRRVQLGHRIARVFDQYTVMRPAMILDWERGGGEGWQPELWRGVVARFGSVHFASRARAFAGRWRPGGAPGRVSLFGISSLPPLYLEVLASMAGHVDVHVFILGPTRGPWTENPLLASMGRQGRELEEILHAVGGGSATVGTESFADPGRGCMLHAVQSRILESAGPGSPLDVDADDDSISVHSCHGPMREVEVLRDRLLDLLHRHPGLEPRDVLVMTPDMEAYAPFVDAVFGSTPRDDPAFVPYRIADRRARSENDAAGAFLAILDLLGGRMGASEVMDVLALDPVRSRYGIEDLDAARGWIAGSGIRWAADADHRRELGLDFEENTWRAGLDRLLVGYAMQGRGRALWQDTLPFDDVDAGAAPSLEGLVLYCETLLELRAGSGRARALGEWAGWLEAVIDMMDPGQEGAWQVRGLRQVVSDLASRSAEAGFDEEVGLDVVRQELARALDSDRPVHAFLSGGVTFCELLPMRSIPMRVVCLIGMNDDAFPRSSRSPGFDLMRRERLTGDRSGRDDDRYIFLETLLGAREHLVITYSGRSMQDSGRYPPSVVVSELLDVMGESFRAGGREPASAEDAQRAIRSLVVTDHPMQPFSPRYFDGRDPRLSSFSRRDCETARRLSAPRLESVPFVAGPVERPLEGRIGVDDLVWFFQHPSRFFLRRVLGVTLGDDAPVVEDREPGRMDGLARYALGSDLLGRLLGGEGLEDAWPALRAAGSLPPGTPGACAFRDSLPVVESLAREFRRHAAGEARAVEVDLDLDGLRLAGRLAGVRPGGIVMLDFALVKPRREIALWISHLVLCCAVQGSLRSVLVGRDGGGGAGTRILERVDEARDLLASLARLYVSGLREPLAFFPASSHEYARVLSRRAGGDEDEARRAAIAGARWKLEGNAFRKVPPERDAYIDTAFRGRDPLSPEVGFDEAALGVWRPYLERAGGDR